MGELGFGHLQKGIVRRIIIEAVLTKKLEKMNCNSMNFWIQAIENNDDKGEMWLYWQDTCENPDTYDELGNKKEDAENTDKAKDKNNEGDNQSETGSKDKDTVDKLGHTQRGNENDGKDTDARDTLDNKSGDTESNGKEQDNDNLSVNKVDVEDETNETKEKYGDGNVAEDDANDKPMTEHKDKTDSVCQEAGPESADGDKIGRRNDPEDDANRNDSKNDQDGKEAMSRDTKANDNSNSKRHGNDDDLQKTAVDHTDSSKEAKLPKADEKPSQSLSTKIRDGKVNYQDKNKSKDNSKPTATELETDVVKPTTGLTAKSGEIGISAQSSSDSQKKNKAEEKQTLLQLSKEAKPKHKYKGGTPV